MSNTHKIGIMARNMKFILDTTITYAVLMTSKISNHQYSVGVKGQVQIYSKSVSRLFTVIPLSFFNGGYLFLAQLLHMVCKLLKHRILSTERHLSQRSRSK